MKNLVRAIGLLLGIAMISGCGVTALGQSQVESSPGDCGGKCATPPMGLFRNTWYFTVRERDFPGQRQETPLLNMRDEVIAMVALGFFKDLRIEGSGIIMDGRVVNFGGRKDGTTRWRFTRSVYGDGVGQCPLVPFHTIAVDPREIPLGTRVFIDETAGLKLPDGTLHDGNWIAEDVGSAIQQDRIDLYTGEGREGGNLLVKQGITNLRALTVRFVEAPRAGNCTTLPMLD